MARICILWEDFITEATGGASESIPEMDGNSPQWRRFFFLRNSIGTIHEIGMALQHLSCRPEFKFALSRQPRDKQISFKKACKELVARKKLIKDLRNKIAGGHVKQEAVAEGLKQMDAEIHGMLQAGKDYRDIRFKFAHRLALETMFPGKTDRDSEKELESFIKLIEGAVHHSLKMIEFVFSIYVKEQRITPL